MTARSSRPLLVFAMLFGGMLWQMHTMPLPVASHAGGSCEDGQCPQVPASDDSTLLAIQTRSAGAMLKADSDQAVVAEADDEADTDYEMDIGEEMDEISDQDDDEETEDADELEGEESAEGADAEDPTARGKRRCRKGYHKVKAGAGKPEHCAKNKCKCKHGHGARGRKCPRHGKKRCRSCKGGYFRTVNKKACKRCVCPNGSVNKALPCKDDKSPWCSGCNSGYTLVQGACMTSCSAGLVPAGVVCGCAGVALSAGGFCSISASGQAEAVAACGSDTTQLTTSCVAVGRVQRVAFVAAGGDGLALLAEGQGSSIQPCTGPCNSNVAGSTCGPCSCQAGFYPAPIDGVTQCVLNCTSAAAGDACVIAGSGGTNTVCKFGIVALGSTTCASAPATTTAAAGGTTTKAASTSAATTKAATTSKAASTTTTTTTSSTSTTTSSSTSTTVR